KEDGLGGGYGALAPAQHLVLWDTQTGKARVLARDEKMVVGLAIAPDGKRVVSSSYGKGTRVWDVGTGKMLWQVPKYNAEEVTFTPDGRHLIAAPGGGQSLWHVWSASDGRPAKGLTPPTVGYVWTFAASPDGEHLLIP